MPIRRNLPGDRVIEVWNFIGNRPVYVTTHNVNAAISTGANVLQALPYSMNGAGLLVGEWDGGSVLATHQEFTGNRVAVADGAAPLNHATHVGGTIAAAGVNSNAKGMAPAVSIASYDWTDDKSEMTALGASYPGEAGKIYISNHSYGFINGWNRTGLASPKWDWWGTGANATAIEQDFGKYDSNARDSDALEYSLPYYLIIRSAGNDRIDNPAAGDPVALTGGSSTAVTYDAAIHPPGDGVYRANGYETISADAIAKNILTIGAVADAVSGGSRDPAYGTMTPFSSWGPTDDGRIKPDLVANGDSLYSTQSFGDTAYGYSSGTSMSSPNATGSAALMVQWWEHLFPGHTLRASTLKALLIHTADDLGTPGPDYRNGWGLINVKAAADLAQAYHDHPGTRRVIEDQLTTARTSRTFSFVWDGVSPIRATLCWTDPAGASTTTSDLRTARLVNNLDLKITDSQGQDHLPFVMPFVGTWTEGNLSAPAVTGINTTDNVEQVLIPTPPAAGVYTIVVSFTGALTNSAQTYSLVVSGGVAAASAAVPTLSAVSPAVVNGGGVTATAQGGGFLTGANVTLIRNGQPAVVALGQEVFPDSIRFRVNTRGMAAGAWDVIVTNPDGQSVVLPAAFTVANALWQDDLETGAAGWSHSASVGTSSSWAVITAQNNSPIHSYFAPGPAVRNVDDLVSPAIQIPANASNLRLSFWHRYDLQSTKDGGVLELSQDDGVTWYDVASAGSGAAFAAGAYNATLSSSGNTSTRNPLAGRQAWSGTSSGFSEVVIDLTDSARYAGKPLRMRWRLATDASTASEGWYIDDVTLSGVAPNSNLPPTITTEASASITNVAANSTVLSVLANDDSGESGLTYTWSASGGPADRPVALSANGTNAAKTTTATFAAAGAYTFAVTVRDSGGLTATSTVNVVVNQTPMSLAVTPATASIVFGGTQNFAALVRDQFGDVLTLQPIVDWSASAGGTIDSAGNFIPMAAGGPYTITGTSGTLASSAQIAVTKATAGVALQNLGAVYDGTPKSAVASTFPASLAVALTYDGQPSPPTNAGSYLVIATVTDPNYVGTASGLLVIDKADATISLTNLDQVFDGTGKHATFSTTPSGLNVALIYNGSQELPVKAGEYAVGATIQHGNYRGSASATLRIAKAAVQIKVSGFLQTYDGTPKPIAVSTVPQNVTCKVNYAGAVAVPINAGSYAVSIIADDPNYTGSADAILQINPAPAALTLSNLKATYDGTPKAAVATTLPAGIAVVFTYDGSPTAPTNAGNYAVAATIADHNYVGAASGVLTIEKAVATIHLTNLEQNYDGTAKPVTATTEPAGLSLQITYDGKADAPIYVGSYAVAVRIQDANFSGDQSGTLVIQGQTYTAWRDQHFGPAKPLLGEANDDADPDADGLANLAEYALGTDPNAINAPPAVTLGPDGLTMTFTRPKALPDVKYTIESSEDATTWLPLPTEVLHSGVLNEDVRAVDPLTTGDPARRFIRLRLTH